LSRELKRFQISNKIFRMQSINFRLKWN